MIAGFFAQSLVSAFDPLQTFERVVLSVPMMTPKRAFLVFSGLYLLSFAALAGWFMLLLIGLLRPDVLGLANRIALPTLASSMVCLEVFRRLAGRAKQRLSKRWVSTHCGHCRGGASSGEWIWTNC